jgi:hypothetical protein
MSVRRKNFPHKPPPWVHAIRDLPRRQPANLSAMIDPVATPPLSALFLSHPPDGGGGVVIERVRFIVLLRVLRTRGGWCASWSATHGRSLPSSTARSTGTSSGRGAAGCSTCRSRRSLISAMRRRSSSRLPPATSARVPMCPALTPSASWRSRPASRPWPRQITRTPTTSGQRDSAAAGRCSRSSSSVRRAAWRTSWRRSRSATAPTSSCRAASHRTACSTTWRPAPQQMAVH